MSLLDQLGGILGQYAGGGTPSETEAPGHFQQVASQVPQSTLGGLLGSVFQSPETGTFGQNISNMYGQSDPQQRAGILNRLLQSGGPGILSSLGLNLPGILGGSHVTPEQAQQISPDAVEQIANHAERQNPGVVQQAADFYSQHPQLVQALGAGAAIWALQRFNRS